ncbi:glycosyltransferase [Oceanobacillus luteolus]|uniref:Glycosyltransferase family 2 protein n=1 Tax=Oceanobacillus luteolus TaxID=1274358 RepID=A0ABW4HYL0_9BACI|nr:glycosyltransferase [Oceanobacillus luteolus]MCM3740876.1 glycosyltransferase [Oceanobacillus luteolus]
MKEITVFLVNYTEQSTIQKTLHSLNIISSKIHSVIVLHEDKSHLYIQHQLFNVEFHKFKTGELSKAVDDLISKIQSEYVLILQNAEYLSPMAITEEFELKASEMVLAHTYHQKQTSVHYPLLIRTEFMKENPFPPEQQLPFSEAIFPAWLSTVDDSRIKIKEKLVMRGREQLNRNWLEKQRFMEKYQTNKTQTTHPSLAIFIANYNMEKYVENAINSCLLQNQKPDRIYIIDDGSSDKSLNKINKWKSISTIEIFHKQNEGKARALNYLLPHVHTNFILELDADDWLDPDAVSVIKKQIADLQDNTAVLYGNLRRWKQTNNSILFKKVSMGRSVKNRQDLLSYHFPLGPRIYRTSSLKKIGGFPIITYQDGRLYEDVSVLNELIKSYKFQYKNFTVYNIREHKESTTRKNLEHWDGFLKYL